MGSLLIRRANSCRAKAKIQVWQRVRGGLVVGWVCSHWACLSVFCSITWLVERVI